LDEIEADMEQLKADTSANENHLGNIQDSVDELEITAYFAAVPSRVRKIVCVYRQR